jgi:hypothetical protein
LIARGIHLEWFEAVAVVQELCKRLLNNPPAGGVRVPDLREIVILEDGAVDVTGRGPESQSPVFRLGEVFLHLVAGGPIPAAVRLLVLTVVSPTPPYSSVAEFSAALDYYERPNRADIVRDVYARWLRLPPAPDRAAAVDADDTIPAAPASDVSAEQCPSRWWRQRRFVVAAAAAVLVLVGTAAGWWLLRAQPRWFAKSKTDVASLARATTESVARVVSSGVEAIREQFGGAPAAPIPVEEPPASVAVVHPGVKPRSVLPTSDGWMKAVGNQAYPLPAPTVGPVAASVADARLYAEAAAVVAPVVAPGDWVIYSADDLDVVPPVAVYQRVPSGPPDGVSADSLPLLELLVSATGEVEKLRLITPTREVRTTMMLSAAKAWRFVPAKRNGVPVRYRQIVRLTSQ